VDTVTDKPIIAFASLGYYNHARGLHQFDERLIHAADASRVERPTRHNTAAERYMGGAFDAVPYTGFDPATYVMPASSPTRLLADGDVIDLGDRAFDVQRLAGVTAGACALFEHATGVLFTGEVLVWDGNYVYDGEPPEVSDDADRVAFRASVQRLAALPAAAVCPGHFGRGNLDAMRAAIAGYIAGTNADQGANTYHD
jgi:glyoxylase-like metal-dependent hydrolase (beta-lactamase superfamily II)